MDNLVAKADPIYFNGIKLSTNQGIVYDQLSKGRTLTNMVAITCYGVGSLSSRIAELRKLGVNIADRVETDQYERQYKAYFVPAMKLAAAEKELEA